MLPYAQFRPTTFDVAGLNLADRQDWLVCPCGINRDSGDRETANWRAMLAQLPASSDDVETHEFGHWACGWFKIAIVRPDTDAARIAEDVECALADYPIVDDDTMSEVEADSRNEAWQSAYGGAYWAADCIAGRCKLGSESRGRLRDMFTEVWDVVACAYDSQACPEYDDNGEPDVRRWVERASRDYIAGLVRDVRRAYRARQSEVTHATV